MRLAKLPSLFLAHNFAHVLNLCTHLSSGGTSSSQAKLSIFLDQSVSGHCDESHSGRTERMTNRKRAAPRVQFIHRQRPQLATENTSVKWDSSNCGNSKNTILSLWTCNFFKSILYEIESWQAIYTLCIWQSWKNTLPGTDNSIILRLLLSFLKITHVWAWYTNRYCHKYHILSV